MVGILSTTYASLRFPGAGGQPTVRHLRTAGLPRLRPPDAGRSGAERGSAIVAKADDNKPSVTHDILMNPIGHSNPPTTGSGRGVPHLEVTLQHGPCFNPLPLLPAMQRNPDRHTRRPTGLQRLFAQLRNSRWRPSPDDWRGDQSSNANRCRVRVPYRCSRACTVPRLGPVWISS